MLSYRHAFHAGGPADVLKHSAFTFTLACAQTKAQPLYILDTHAGAGLYDLAAPMATKRGEWQGGIERLFGLEPPWPELVQGHLQHVRAANPDGRLRYYPGSASLAASYRRARDRVELCELHPTDHAILAEQAAGLEGVSVLREDGLELFLRRMPPRERRGIVLIDPSYEVKTEPAAVIEALAEAYAAFPTGIFLVWYPVLERARTEAFIEALVATGIRRQYRLELAMLPDGSAPGMTASGLVIVNPPWALPAAAEAGLPWLVDHLAATGPGTARWLVPK